MCDDVVATIKTLLINYMMCFELQDKYCFVLLAEGFQPRYSRQLGFLKKALQIVRNTCSDTPTTVNQLNQIRAQIRQIPVTCTMVFWSLLHHGVTCARNLCAILLCSLSQPFPADMF